MKLLHSAPWLATAGLLLSGIFSTLEAPPRAADELVFRSVEGRKLAKEFVQHSDLELKKVHISVETPDGPQEQDIEDASGTIVDDETIKFVDEALTKGDGKPKKLKRTFEEISNTQGFESEAEGAEDASTENKSGFDGKSVVFTWDEDADGFEAEWFESEGEDALLKLLVEDADFRGWLPGKKVEEGDTWDIPAKEFNNLQEPSGPMAYVPEDSEEPYDEGELSRGLRDGIDGEFKATYKGTREEGGVQVGVIAFRADLKTTAEQETEQEGGATLKNQQGMAVEFEGELLWDLEGGHFTALNCDSEVKLTIINSQAMEMNGAAISIEQTQVFEGKKTYRFTCAVKKD